MAEALQHGVEKGRVELALNLIKLGLDNAGISQVTGLSIEQIKSLRT